MAWSDVVTNKRNAQGTHYRDKKIGPLISFFHRENLEYATDECQKFLSEEQAPKEKEKLKRWKKGVKAVELIKETLESHKPNEWNLGVSFEWDLAVHLKQGLDEMGFRVLRNYPIINQLHEILERHVLGVSEYGELQDSADG